MNAPVDIHHWLRDRQIPYRTLIHSPRFTAQEVAQASHVTGYEVAKVIVVKADDRFVIAVIPAAKRLDLLRVKQTLAATDVQLATEEEFAPLFPGSEKGAMPPFGSIYGLEMIVDRSFAEHPEIAFSAGNHIETLFLKWEDYRRAASPDLAEIAGAISDAA
jgi:Ala-tRNA(Pro) deacylase